MPRKGRSGDRKKWRKVDRIGSVTIYKRGPTYYLYYRENDRSLKPPVGRDLNEARRLASQTDSQLRDMRPTAFNIEHIGVEDFATEWLAHCRTVRGLSHETLKRYWSAIDHFVQFAGGAGICRMEDVTPPVMEEFLKHMRAKQRTCNGKRRRKGTNPSNRYSERGIAFVLATCRTAFDHAIQRCHMRPYAGNPCKELPIDSMSKTPGKRRDPFTPEQEAVFYGACNDWQFGIFFTLAAVGIRRNELRFLLVSDVDWKRRVVHIRNKPEVFWSTKTRRDRKIPIFPLWESVLKERIGSRGEGFVFLNESFYPKPGKLPEKRPAGSFKDYFEMTDALKARLDEVENRMEGTSEDALMRGKRRAIHEFLRDMGQIPSNRIRQDFIKLTRKIGLPRHTSPHEFRHLCARSMKEAGTDPFARQAILGHASLEMTGRYTNTRVQTTRQAVEQALRSKPDVLQAVRKRLKGSAG